VASSHSLGGGTLEGIGALQNDVVLRRLQPKGLPLLYEDEGLEMGESSVHARTTGILLYGLTFHFAENKKYRVFGNLNQPHKNR
jgi:hypothetical protein